MKNSKIGIYTADILIYTGSATEKAKKQFTSEAVKLAVAQRMLSPSTDWRLQFFRICGSKTANQIVQLMYPQTFGNAHEALDHVLRQFSNSKLILILLSFTHLGGMDTWCLPTKGFAILKMESGSTKRWEIWELVPVMITSHCFSKSTSVKRHLEDAK